MVQLILQKIEPGFKPEWTGELGQNKQNEFQEENNFRALYSGRKYSMSDIQPGSNIKGAGTIQHVGFCNSANSVLCEDHAAVSPHKC